MRRAAPRSYATLLCRRAARPESVPAAGRRAATSRAAVLNLCTLGRLGKRRRRWPLVLTHRCPRSVKDGRSRTGRRRRRVVPRRHSRRQDRGPANAVDDGMSTVRAITLRRRATVRASRLANVRGLEEQNKQPPSPHPHLAKNETRPGDHRRKAATPLPIDGTVRQMNARRKARDPRAQAGASFPHDSATSTSQRLALIELSRRRGKPADRGRARPSVRNRPHGADEERRREERRARLQHAADLPSPSRAAPAVQRRARVQALNDWVLKGSWATSTRNELHAQVGLVQPPFGFHSMLSGSPRR